MPSDEKIERMLEQVGNAAVVLAEGIRDHNRPSEVFQALLDTLGAVVKEEVPDPADLTTYASALLLQKENEKLHECVKVLRRALSRVQFYWPERGRVFAICLGCGAALDVGHADDCEINNALNPKPAEPNCPECEHARPRDLGDRVSADRYCAADQLQPEKLKGNAFPFCRDVYKQDCQHFHKADS